MKINLPIGSTSFSIPSVPLNKLLSMSVLIDFNQVKGVWSLKPCLPLVSYNYWFWISSRSWCVDIHQHIYNKKNHSIQLFLINTSWYFPLHPEIQAYRNLQNLWHWCRTKNERWTHVPVINALKNSKSNKIQWKITILPSGHLENPTAEHQFGFWSESD